MFKSNRRYLKKNICKEFENLLRDCFYYECFSTSAEVKQVRKIRTDILDSQSKFVSMICNYKKNNNEKTARIYFSKLYKELEAKIDKIEKELVALP